MARAIKLPPGGVPCLPIRMAPLYAGAVTDARANQDAVFSEAFAVLEEAIQARAFPGASFAVTRFGRLISLKAFGRFTYEDGAPAVTTETIFDVASLTKVVATTTMAMILYERGLLDLEAPLVGVLPEFARRICDGGINFRMLLAHSSGLPAYEKLFLRVTARENMLESSIQGSLEVWSGNHAEYSDIGFILLGVAWSVWQVNRSTVFCQREIFGPLGMTRRRLIRRLNGERRFHPPRMIRRFVSESFEEKCKTRTPAFWEVSPLMLAVLHRTGSRNLRAMHAERRSNRSCGPKLWRAFTRREASPAGTSRALGWDTPSAPSQSGNTSRPCLRTFGLYGYLAVD